jgi:hypothetical protein
MLKFIISFIFAFIATSFLSFLMEFILWDWSSEGFLLLARLSIGVSLIAGIFYCFYTGEE